MRKPHHTTLLIFTINILACLVPLSALADIVFVKASTTDFHHPHDLSLDPSGRWLFVADMNNDVVKILDPQTLTIVGKIGENELDSPHDLTFDNQGRLVVADSGNSRLVVYELNGKQGKAVKTIANGMSSPEGVAVDKHHNIYVANTGSHNVVQLKDGNIALKAGGAGREIENYIRPHDVEIWNNRLFITDPGNNRIKILNMQLQFITTLAGKSYDFNEPKYLGLDETGLLYIADQYNNQIKIFNTDYKLIDTIKSYTIDAKSISLNKPEGILAVGLNIWVSDTYNDRIVLYAWTKKP